MKRLILLLLIPILSLGACSSDDNGNMKAEDYDFTKVETIQSLLVGEWLSDDGSALLKFTKDKYEIVNMDEGETIAKGEYELKAATETQNAAVILYYGGTSLDPIVLYSYEDGEVSTSYGVYTKQ